MTRGTSHLQPQRSFRLLLTLLKLGSVGLPTNRERRAEFLILDDSDPTVWAVEKYEVEYSRETARARVRGILGKECRREIVEQICRWL